MSASSPYKMAHLAMALAAVQTHEPLFRRIEMFPDFDPTFQLPVLGWDHPVRPRKRKIRTKDRSKAKAARKARRITRAKP